MPQGQRREVKCHITHGNVGKMEIPQGKPLNWTMWCFQQVQRQCCSTLQQAHLLGEELRVHSMRGWAALHRDTNAIEYAAKKTLQELITAPHLLGEELRVHLGAVEQHCNWHLVS